MHIQSYIGAHNMARAPQTFILSHNIRAQEVAIKTREFMGFRLAGFLGFLFKGFFGFSIDFASRTY